MELPEGLTERARRLGSLIDRVRALASGLARRSRLMGWVSLVAAPVAWITLFGRWAFDSVGRFLFFLVVLGVLAAPGLILVVFARLLAGTVSRSETAAAELGSLVSDGASQARERLAAATARPGLRSLGTLLASLWRLRGFRSEFGSVVGAVAGSTRLLNPLFLLWVAGAALGAGLVMVLAVVGVVIALV